MITRSQLFCLAAFLLTLLIGSLQAIAQTSSSTAPNSKPGTISGRVVNENGRPLPNVHIFVMRAGSLTPNPTTTSATTDREGKFELSGLEPVSYHVSAFLRGYVPSIRDLDDTQPGVFRVGDSVTFVLTKGGVITGTVTNQAGEPIVGVVVRVRMVADRGRLAFPYDRFDPEFSTDDRGIYRMWGLPEGTYVVWAGGGSNGFNQNADPFETDVPTYAPASTRDTAERITVRAGVETSNVDIQYRGDEGHMVSGVATGPPDSQARGFAIFLSSVAGGGPQWGMRSSQTPDSRGFLFRGIDDGDYQVTAVSPLPNGELLMSAPKQIRVRGADVTGVELSVQPLSSVSGRVVLEDSKATECSDKQRPLLTDTLVFAQTETVRNASEFVWLLGPAVNADAQGNVSIKNLPPGRYYFGTQFSGKDWYLKSLTFPPTDAANIRLGKPIDAARSWTTLKPGDRLSGLAITLAQGAASLRGGVELREGETLPEKLYVYLVPAEKEKADDPLRFYGAAVTAEGKLALNNLAPGRYWVFAQTANQETASPLTQLRWPNQAAYRVKLRRVAEAAKTEIELKPCQKLVDIQIRVK